jgi:hypothetical protein
MYLFRYYHKASAVSHKLYILNYILTDMRKYFYLIHRINLYWNFDATFSELISASLYNSQINKNEICVHKLHQNKLDTKILSEGNCSRSYCNVEGILTRVSWTRTWILVQQGPLRSAACMIFSLDCDLGLYSRQGYCSLLFTIGSPSSLEQIHTMDGEHFASEVKGGRSAKLITSPYTTNKCPYFFLWHSSSTWA